MTRICQAADEHGGMVLWQASGSGPGNSPVRLVLQSNGEFSLARCQTPFEVSITSFGIDFSFKVSPPLPSQEPGFPLPGRLVWEF